MPNEGRSKKEYDDIPVMIQDRSTELRGRIDNGGFNTAWPDRLLSTVLFSASAVSASGIELVVEETRLLVCAYRNCWRETDGIITSGSCLQRTTCGQIASMVIVNHLKRDQGNKKRNHLSVSTSVTADNSVEEGFPCYAVCIPIGHGS